MIRYAALLAYNGTGFSGWQRQKNAYTIQECIEENLEKLCRGKVGIVGCGRTDAGVHASQFVFHFDLEQTLPDQLLFKLNSMLPEGIVIYWIKEVEHNFHSRFAAKKRRYHYYVHTYKDPFHSAFSCFLWRTPNWELMNEMAKDLIGTKEFGAFCKSGSDNDNVICTVEEAYWEKIDEHRYRFVISANRFLRNMVRAVVGTLLQVGNGQISPEEWRAILAANKRELAGTSAIANGLFLTKIEYPTLPTPDPIEL